MAQSSRRARAPQIAAAGLIRWRGYLWVLGKARKPAVCWLTGAEIAKGAECYRPLTNGLDRFRRVSAAALEKRAAVI